MDNTLKYSVKQYTQAGTASIVACCINLAGAQSVLAGLAAATSEFMGGMETVSGPMEWMIRDQDGRVIEHFWIEELADHREAIKWPNLELPPINLMNAPAPGIHPSR
ncbi:hypothetical protein [Thioalkalivibrio sp. ALE16]|uniref:hypothetical protein n=1 Tax=Thioalkalivibrio sp. ALE16 TaxID=1158172 RepID=UPI00036AB23A|nr:hypothetical protein [Thioalkalivibrio sp. ALE16]